jgi:hypothetical protein
MRVLCGQRDAEQTPCYVRCSVVQGINRSHREYVVGAPVLEFMIVSGAAVLAAGLALAGGALLNWHQECRLATADRDLPRPDADELVTELDLLVRRLGAAALLGSSVTGEQPRHLFEQNWEGDLLRRLRRMGFGHPSPRVRAAARAVKDRMWPLFVAATDIDCEGYEELRHPDQRARVVAEIDAAMVELKRVTHTGVFRAAPGPMATDVVQFRPSRLSRVLAERTTTL